MYVSLNQVKLHDTDMTGMIYYPKIFRFAEEALEEWMQENGYSFKELYYTNNHGIFFVTKAACVHLTGSALVGDRIEVRIVVAKIKKCSFDLHYEILKREGGLIGTIDTTHVILDKTSKKISPIPENMLKLLEKHPLTDMQKP